MSKKNPKCPRCGGLMNWEKFYAIGETFQGWRCVICGEILDPVIILHRLSRNPELEIPEGLGKQKTMLMRMVAA